MKAIMYHYIRNSNKDMPFFRYLSIDNFKKQLDYFEKEYGFVTYDEFNSFLNDYSLYDTIKNRVILTFDDGFLDHYEYVLPELLKRNLFGLFYIPTGVYEKKKALDVHRIHFLLGKYGGEVLIDAIKNRVQDHMLQEKEVNTFKEITYTTQDNDFYTQEFKKIFNYYIKYEHRENLLDEIVKEFSSEEEIFTNLYMSIEQLKEMQTNNMIIGSHSVNHFVFSKLSNSEQYYEINNSFKFLEQNSEKSKVKTFCFPYGGFETFTDYTEKILHNCGCDFSFNVEYRDIELKDFKNRAQALPRYDCNQFLHGNANLG
ncbi:MAG: polysaccharide deacetylase family protein [Helicobacteraceae bacterium]|nr:polysaccharide deacetylase family protein [Helicobacteraceae bacterium]